MMYLIIVTFANGTKQEQEYNDIDVHEYCENMFMNQDIKAITIYRKHYIYKEIRHLRRY